MNAQRREEVTYLIGRCIIIAQMIENSLSCIEVRERKKKHSGAIHNAGLPQQIAESRAWGGIKDIVGRIDSKYFDDDLKLRLWKIADFRDKIAHRLMQNSEFISGYSFGARWVEIHEMDNLMMSVNEVLLADARRDCPPPSTAKEVMLSFADIMNTEIVKARSGNRRKRANQTLDTMSGLRPAMCHLSVGRKSAKPFPIVLIACGLIRFS